MELSARNQLKGRVKGVKLGAVMAEVLVDVSGQEVVSVITRGSVEALSIQEGDAVTVVIKSDRGDAGEVGSSVHPAARQSEARLCTYHGSRSTPCRGGPMRLSRR
jgi:molybdopterin-binding protein